MSWGKFTNSHRLILSKTFIGIGGRPSVSRMVDRRDPLPDGPPSTVPPDKRPDNPVGPSTTNEGSTAIPSRDPRKYHRINTIENTLVTNGPHTWPPTPQRPSCHMRSDHTIIFLIPLMRPHEALTPCQLTQLTRLLTNYCRPHLGQPLSDTSALMVCFFLILLKLTICRSSPRASWSVCPLLCEGPWRLTRLI